MKVIKLIKMLTGRNSEMGTFLILMGTTLMIAFSDRAIAEGEPKPVLTSTQLPPDFRKNATKACPENCTTTAECKNVKCLGEFGVCNQITSKCTCDEKLSVPRNDGSSCLPIQKQIGGPCTEPLQCQRGEPGLYSTCSSAGKCNCTDQGITDGKGDHCFKRATEVRGECDVDSQCTANLMLSRCVHKMCECWPNTVVSRTGCYKPKSFGQTCEISSQCTYNNELGSGCINGTCGCVEDGYAQNPTPEKNTTCMSIATRIGQSCNEHTDQCKNLVNATCTPKEEDSNPNSYCGCDDTQTSNRNGTSCLFKKFSLNDECTECQQCQVGNSVCASFAEEERRCACASGYVAGVDNPNQCLPIATSFGNPCVEDIQCKNIYGHKDTLSCYHGTCGCQPTEKYINSLCIAPLKHNESCNFTEQCALGENSMTWCAGENNMESESAKWCQCNRNAIRLRGICFEVKRVWDKCVNSFECQVTIGGTVECGSNKVCECADKGHVVMGGFSCPVVNSANYSASNKNMFIFIISVLAVLIRKFN